MTEAVADSSTDQVVTFLLFFRIIRTPTFVLLVFERIVLIPSIHLKWFIFDQSAETDCIQMCLCNLNSRSSHQFEVSIAQSRAFTETASILLSFIGPAELCLLKVGTCLVLDCHLLPFRKALAKLLATASFTSCSHIFEPRTCRKIRYLAADLT